MADLRVFSFYLPQFHPIPENDEWWGRGFTEWTNVARAQPLFRGHEQPHLPGELGFYDLRLPDTRQAQATLAREHGIEGFIYYHYWFNGRRLLERPFDEVRASGEPDFPFALCWANENWTRTWDGAESHVLMPQAHSAEDDLEHIRWLASAFQDPRYIKVEGKPLFLVYRASELPDPAATAALWRKEAARLGIGELYLCKVDSFSAEAAATPTSMGFDAAVEWIPHWDRIGPPQRRSRVWRLLARARLTSAAYLRHRIHDYDEVVAATMADRPEPVDHVRFPTVTPRWDNSPRKRDGALIFKNARPASYRRWLDAAIQRSLGAADRREPLVFISAWNEWAEGNHLEPDEASGRAYLEATRDAIRAVLPALSQT